MRAHPATARSAASHSLSFSTTIAVYHKQNYFPFKWWKGVPQVSRLTMRAGVSQGLV